jgi:hypothetical protein
MVSRARGENHPNAKLTDQDVEQIRQLIEWKKEEIARINSIASCAALAEKFDVSIRCIEHISAFRSRCAPTEGLAYFAAKTEDAKKNISSAKIAQNNSAAGEFTKRTGTLAIDAIRAHAKLYTATEVANYIGWASVTSMRSWMKLRGYEVEFKKHKPIPPRRKGWGAIDLSQKARAQSPASL